MKRNQYIKEIARLLSYIKKGKYLFIILSLLSALTFAANRILIGLANKSLINSAADKSEALLYTAGIYAGIAFFLLLVVDPIIRYIKDRVAIRFMKDFRVSVFSHIERLPMRYFDKGSGGDLISRMTDDMNKVNMMWYAQLRSLLVSFFHGIGAGITILLIDWRLFFLILVLGLLSVKANTAFAKPIRALSEKIQNHGGIATQSFLDILYGARPIKMFNIGHKIYGKFAEESNAAAEAAMMRSSKNAQMESISFLLSAFNLLGVLAIGLVMASRNLIDMGSVMAVITLQGGLTSMFLSLGQWVSRMQISLASAKRIFEILDHEVEADYGFSNTYKADETRAGNLYKVEFEHVSFGYDEKDLVLNHFNLTAEPNQRTALVGGSGGGKSTIVKLLMGFYTSQKGSIKIGGRLIADYSLEALRQMISYVPQEAYLFDGTIKDNIGYGNPNASDEQIVQAAKAVNAHSFIMELQEGYEAQVGEKGTRLSGGQRQRIALARAILKDAPILLLDEATSALDSENERLVQEALSNFSKNRTTIIIAHRLSTIENAHKICVIEKGAIVEEGGHKELIQKESYYHHLYHMQFDDKKLAV